MGKPKIIYITGFRQHAGKTVTSLGLISVLRKYIDPERIGYIKPVGQELVALPDGSKIDKDAIIIEKFSGIPDLDMQCVSPVRLGSGFTKNFLLSPNRARETKKLKNWITQAFEKMSGKDIIISEGTGHPGVGGIVGISNAEVSKLIGAETIFLSGGGIGKALDQLEVDLSYFRFNKAEVRGIIFNKLIPEKITTVQKYITEDLINSMYKFDKPIQVLGYLPEVDDLYKPSMRVVKNKIKNCEAIGNTERDEWTIPFRSVAVITLPDEHLKLDKHIKDGAVVIIGAGSKRRLNRIVQHHLREDVNNKLAGLILTCGSTIEIFPETRELIEKSNIPAIFVQDDTAAVESQLFDCFRNTKLQPYDHLKIKQLEEMFDNHFDVEKFFKTFDIKK